MKISAEWTPDCQGKWDFDGEIIGIRTRYWPRGGGFMEFNTATGRFTENDDRPHIQPHANCKIVILDGEEDVTLVEVDIRAETEEDVKRQVEAWAAEQYAKTVAAMQEAFRKMPSEP